MSHPHGCVSWNIGTVWGLVMCWRHTLTGVWVEIQIQLLQQAGRMSHPHGCVSWNGELVGVKKAAVSHPHGCVSWNIVEELDRTHYQVTPSRVCELKCASAIQTPSAPCHTLTGVWVEIFCFTATATPVSHTLTGVWVEMAISSKNIQIRYRHTLTGVWVEIFFIISRLSPQSHTLTGVWVEISSFPTGSETPKCHTLTGVWVEIRSWEYSQAVQPLSHPHGCVSWNW